MQFSPIELLKHILDEAKYLLDYSKELKKEDFIQNETLKRAFVRSIEIIGEATKKIPDDFKIKYPDIEWKPIAGMRDKLIHDYMGIDYDIVWDVLVSKIPGLYKEIKKILQIEGN